MPSFKDMLQAKWDQGKFVCVGLDSDTNKLPQSLEGYTDRQTAFNMMLIKVTHDLVCAYKPNLAFYRGGFGKKELRRTIGHGAGFKQQHPNYPGCFIKLLS